MFDWGDIAEADDKSCLAIPKHRIEYFKVDERIVWNKSTRTDDVFGSTGGGTNIVDVLKELEADAAASQRMEVEMREDGDERIVGEENRKMEYNEARTGEEGEMERLD